MYSTILVPVDTSYADPGWLRKTLGVAYDLAKKSAGTLHLVTVIPDNLLKGYYPDIYSEEVANEVKARLQTIVKDIIPHDATVQLHVRTGGSAPKFYEWRAK
jgi:nucleotide-binding universal stress UspA family protein